MLRRGLGTAAAAARSLSGRVALVTGSASGIGLGVAKVLASRGADVVLHGLAPRAELDKLERDIADMHGVRVVASDANLMNGAEAAVELRDLSLSKMGKHIDILVNNAGIQHVSPIESFDADAFDRVIAVNLSAVFHLTKAVIPAMRQARYGRIINVSSVHGLVASAEKAAYVAAKHGVLGLTKVTALETANSGITCNAICPGWVLTPLVEAQIERRADMNGTTFEEEKVAMLAEKQPQTRFTMPEELGELAAFLCSDAAANMTGTSLPMDGGWTAQ